MADIVKIGAKGQLVLPRRVRAAWGLREGDELVLETQEESLVLTRKARRFGEYLDNLGKLKPPGRKRKVKS